jgi:threonyl-tRNA synthetase
LVHLESIMKTLITKRAKFERMVVPLEAAVAMFATNPFKLKYLHRLAASSSSSKLGEQQITVYRCGDFIDLCKGPHLPHTGLVKAFKLTQTSSSQWTPLSTAAKNTLPNSTTATNCFSSNALTRVTGTSFLTSAALNTHLHNKATAAARDHRAIGTKQSLFFFHPFSPGSPFLLPHGTRIMNALVGMLRGEYRRRGFEEVVTPLLFDKRVWQVSGHWENYRDDMFIIGMGTSGGGGGGGVSCGDHSHHHPSHDLHGDIDIHKENQSTKDSKQGQKKEDDDQTYGLKPMNCPGHCLMYASSKRSYKELPIRYAEFSPLHR